MSILQLETEKLILVITFHKTKVKTIQAKDMEFKEIMIPRDCRLGQGTKTCQIQEQDTKT